MENKVLKYGIGKKIGIIFLGVILYSFIMTILSGIYLFGIIILSEIESKITKLNILNNDTISAIYFILTLFLGIFIFNKFVKNKTLFRKLLFGGFIIVFIVLNFMFYSLAHCSCRS